MIQTITFYSLKYKTSLNNYDKEIKKPVVGFAYFNSMNYVCRNSILESDSSIFA